MKTESNKSSRQDKIRDNIIGFSVVLNVLLVFLVFIVLPTDCAPQFSSDAPGNPISCGDYWFERYQTLIGGLFALSAAILTVRQIKKQLRYMEHQVDEQQLRLFRLHVARVDEESIAIEKIRQVIEGGVKHILIFLEDMTPGAQLIIKKFPIYEELMKDFAEAGKSYERMVATPWGDDHVFAIQKKFSRYASAVGSAYLAYHSLLWQITQADNPEAAYKDRVPNLSETATNFKILASGGAAIYDECKRMLEGELERGRVKARQLEAKVYNFDT